MSRSGAAPVETASTRAAPHVRPQTLDADWRFHWPVAAAFAVLGIALSYPGRLNADSLFALIAAPLPGFANNWHSATLGWFWSLLAPWLGQPLAALTVQALLFGAFAGFLPRLTNDARGRAAFAGELLLRVALAGCVGYVGKDAVMLLTLLLVVQLMRRWPRRPLSSAGVLVLASMLLLFLLSKAPNFVVLVVAAALVLPFFVRTPLRYFALVAAAGLLGALAIPLNRTVDAVVFSARDVHPDQQLVLFDLAGISVQTGRNVFADAPGWPTARLPDPRSCYLPYMWDSFAHWAPCGAYSTAYDRLDRTMVRHWAASIAAHPLAYLRHRLDYIAHLMVSRDHATWGLGGRAINAADDPAAIAELQALTTQLPPSRPIAQWRPAGWTAPFQWFEQALFRFPKVQWFGLLACLSVLLFAWLRRGEGVRFGAILAAGLGTGNFVMLTLFGVADPARYLLPTVGLGYVALLALLSSPREDIAPATP